MRKTTVVALGAVVMVLATLALRPAGEATVDGEDAGALTGAAPGPASAASRPAVDAPALAPPAATALAPRPNRLAASALDAGSAPLPPRLRLAERGGALVDRRASPGRDGPSEIELIHAGLDTIHDDIAACLEAWRGTDTEAAGEVMIRFQLDESGLTDSWVVREAELPFGIRTCFATAVHGVDWSHVVRQPAEITERFTLEREDAGS